MPKEKHSSLEEMYQDLSDEAEELEKRIKENLFRISEIDEYLSSIYEREEEDFKIFSPRSADHIYKEDIDDHKAKKSKLEIDNRSLYSRLNKIRDYLEGLEGSIKEEAVPEMKPVSIQKNLQVLDVQEKDRQRIARDLHDTSLQNLTHLVHKIELASLYMDKDVVQAKLELASVSKGLKAVIEEMRNTVFDLRPMHFDDFGLKESFERLFTKLKESNTSFDFETKIDEISCDSDLIQMTIFRVVQEACANAVKHSKGNKIKVTIEQKNDECHILIRDNGIGFSERAVAEKADRHFGLSIMKERVLLLGGTFSIDSVLHEGTDIRMRIPLSVR